MPASAKQLPSADDFVAEYALLRAKPRRRSWLLTALTVAAAIAVVLVAVRERLLTLDVITLQSAHGSGHREDCVFLHGAGAADTRPPTPTDQAYWGAVHEWTPQCKSRRFLHVNTLDAGWESRALQQQVCELLGARAPSWRVADVLIFAHSMGNLVLAAAFENGVCSLAPSAAWFGAAAPWRGSKAAETLPDICAGKLTSYVRDFARRRLMCEGHGGGPSPGYWSVRTSNPALRRVARWAARLNGSICGETAFGLLSWESWELEALARVVGFGEPDDGVITVRSCEPAAKALGASSCTYDAGVNHYDTTCRHGNGWWGSNRQPCSWYAAMRPRGAETCPFSTHSL